MDAHADRNRRRDEAGRRTIRVRAVVVSGALLGSLAVAGGLTAQAVTTAPSSSHTTGTTGQTSVSEGRAAPLVGSSDGHQSHATTQGS